MSPPRITAPLCICGCGLPRAPYYKKDGRRGGYGAAHAPDCPNPYRHDGPQKKRTTSDPRKGVPQPQLQGMNHPRAKPIGSRRLHDPGNNTGPYWLVKVTERGRWVYEHRHIIEQEIGRKLATTEHVHHMNHDTLDNRRSNLRLMTQREHRQHHASEFEGWAKEHDACIECGQTDSVHASHGRCNRCYLRNWRKTH